MKKLILALTLILTLATFIACTNDAPTQINDSENGFTTETVNNSPMKGQSTEEDPGYDMNALGNPYNMAGIAHNEILELVLEKVYNRVYPGMHESEVKRTTRKALIDVLIQDRGFKFDKAGLEFEGYVYKPGQEGMFLSNYFSIIEGYQFDKHGINSI